MRITTLFVFATLFAAVSANAQINNTVLQMGKDGLPAGNSSPEGAASDLIHAHMLHDAYLFNMACVPPYGGSKVQDMYIKYIKRMTLVLKRDAKLKTKAPDDIQSIDTVYAARHLTKAGPASYAYSALNDRDVEFVDIGVTQVDGRKTLRRVLVIQTSDGKWYAHPLPTLSPLLSDGLRDETISTQDFREAYNLKK